MPGPVIDIDSHIWENLPLMAEYLDPKYRDLALSIEVDDRGLEYMSVEGRMPHNLFLREGRFGRMAAGKSIEEKRDLYLKPGAVTYAQGLVNVPASHQPGPRVQVLDHSACCGMAGSFGFEAEHYEISKAMAWRTLVPAVDAAPSDTAIAVTGVSCRQQIGHFSSREPRHVAEYLAEALVSRQPGRPA